ncbi:MAG TPA: DUF6249 domain-containing protein [Bacteroidales bacterium]|nr:DUF6249 domain-containing protein [Bacteroidales bacterium]
MKKFGLIMIALFLSLAINLSAQTKAVSHLQDSTLTQTSDTVSEAKDIDDLVDDLVNKTVSAKIQDLDLDSDAESATGFVGTIMFMVIAMPILITFAAVVLIIFLVLRYRKIREKGRYDLYVKALEAGQPLPDKFFEEPAKTSSSNLRRGAVLIAVGLGMAVLGLLGKNVVMIGIGAIPGFIGIAFMLIYNIERKHKKEE